MSKNKRRTSADPDPLAQMFSGLWAALGAGDVLAAEVETARCCVMFHQLGIDQDKSDAILIGMAKQGGQPEDAALLRLLMLLGSPAAKGKARTALGELTSRGVYPANWVAEAGKAEPVRAMRRYDPFGDGESIAVTFRYAGGEHTLVAQVDLANLPRVSRLGLTDGELAPEADSPLRRSEELSLADVRAHLDPALRATESGGFLEPDAAALLPIARSRLRRLPAGDREVAHLHTGAERAALVQEFLASPHAAQAVAQDKDATRFWAEIATAWSSRRAGLPPLQAGPVTLTYLLDQYVPATYPVTAAQREQMAVAVTAWARWSAAKRDVDQDHMVAMLPRAFSAFADSYDDGDRADARAYLSDVAASDADVAGLRAVWSARAIAMPPRAARAGHEAGLAALDATDAADRARFLAADFAGCGLPAGLSRDDFLAVLGQVAEQLWHGDQAGTREHALALLAEGELDRHDIMHALTQRAPASRS